VPALDAGGHHLIPGSGRRPARGQAPAARAARIP
jgi:hypothetical protein